MPTALDLFERHHRSVFGFLRRLEGSTEDAEDLTQEVFLRVLRAVDGYEERQLESAWVFRIARNVWLDHRRARSRAPQPTSLVDIHAVSPHAGQTSRLALDQALARLSAGEREAFLMREVGGLGYLEIAEATSATPDAVRSRIHRARLALRGSLERVTSFPAAVSRREA